MLKLKLQYFDHLMRRTKSLEKTLMLGKVEGRRRRWQRMRWLDDISHCPWPNGHEFAPTPEDSEGQGSLVCHGVARSRARLSDWTTKEACQYFDDGTAVPASLESSSPAPQAPAPSPLPSSPALLLCGHLQPLTVWRLLFWRLYGTRVTHFFSSPEFGHRVWKSFLTTWHCGHPSGLVSLDYKSLSPEVTHPGWGPGSS